MEYLDLERLSDEDELLRRNVHRLAEEVLRPISIKLDRMSPRDRIRPNSPIFEAIREMKKMGLHRIHLPRDRGGVGLTNLQRYIIDEELGWGSLGLATLIGVDAIPFTVAAMFGSERVREEVVKPWLEDVE
ncbi:MAG: acyl-CoA dehydrogenase family protein, partial [Vulcanisaeta sp.]